MEPLLEIRHLSVSFSQYEKGAGKRRLQVIRDLSLTVQTGEIVVIAGASGSGKSLLAHGIMGLLPYNSHMEGEILYDGSPLSPERAAGLRGKEISLIPQGAAYLDPLMRVGDQLRKGKKDARTRQRCREALARYGLTADTEKMYPFELSGGMARRVMIASAVVDRPRLIIADEPIPGLDGRTAAGILGHFRELADEGAGMLFITHDLCQVLPIADKVEVFYAGETVEEAGGSDFQDARTLRHPYSRALWHAMPEHGFVPAPGTQPYAGDRGGGCVFAGQCQKKKKDCTERDSIPLRQWKGGKVRCLYPEGEENR